MIFALVYKCSGGLTSHMTTHMHALESISVKPTDITVGSVRLDKRPGFFGHVFLTISWQHPPGMIPLYTPLFKTEVLYRAPLYNYSGYVEHYTVKAFPFSSENVYTSPRLVRYSTLIH